MKLGKEEIQKIVLGLIGLTGVTAVYFMLLLDPLEAKQARTKGGIAATRPKIAEAKAQIKRTQDMEDAAPKATLTLKQLTALIPDGSPVAWFPTQVGDFFKREGVDKAVTHMMTEMPEKDLDGFRRISWGIEVPRIDFVPWAQSLADFENEELLVEVTSVQIEAIHDDAESQHVTLTVNNFAKQ